MVRLSLWLLVLAALAASAYAQDATERPLVAFVVDDRLGTAAITETGPSGLSALVQIFIDRGAAIQAVNLDTALPADARVVVLARPQAALSAEQLARLWTHMEHGNHLLLAIDPLNYGGRPTDSTTGGLAVLLNSDYGINLQDSFLAEPWFAVSNMADLNGSLLFAQADALPNPVTAPLDAYDLPVSVWGARTLRVEPFGINSRARPLLRTVTAYGETSRRVFANDPDPLELNIGVDFLGKLNLAALGENTASGSRVAILGDSELVLNGFGLSDDPDTRLPRSVGNRIFIERLAAWLLDGRVEEWPPLPTGFTWVAIDGASSEWANVPVVTASETDARPPVIQQVRAFRNDAYSYLLVETSEAAAGGTRLELTFSSFSQSRVHVSAQGRRVAVIQPDGTETVIPDARAAAAGTAVEIRLPLRITGSRNLTLSDVCLFAEGNAAEPQGCFNTRVTVIGVEERDPASLRLSNNPIVTINPIATTAVNVRSGPNTTFSVVSSLKMGVTLAVTGRNEAGTWIKVETGAFSGWLLAVLGIVNTDVMTLPVVQTP
jgi:hypothetical protein